MIVRQLERDQVARVPERLACLGRAGCRPRGRLVGGQNAHKVERELPRVKVHFVQQLECEAVAVKGNRHLGVFDLSCDERAEQREWRGVNEGILQSLENQANEFIHRQTRNMVCCHSKPCAFGGEVEAMACVPVKDVSTAGRRRASVRARRAFFEFPSVVKNT